MAWTDKQLASHKKAQAGLSASAAILGVGALGAKGVGTAASRAAKGAGFAAKSTGLRKVPKGTLKRVGAGANRTAEGLSYGSIGVGGASGLNFAGVSSAEAKRVHKSDGGAMDFGLSGVRQHGAQEISKAGGMVHVPRGFTQGRPRPESVKSFTKKRRLKRVAVGSAVGATGLGGSAVVYDRHRKGSVSKRRDGWMNISEHEQRAKDSRRRGRNADSVAGLGVLGAGVSAGLASNRGRNVGAEISNLSRATGGNFRNFQSSTNKKTALRNARGSMTTAVKLNRYGAGVLAGAGLAVGATAAGVGHGFNERHHNKEIGRLRKKRAMVTKAYDPERNREGRLRNYQSGLTAGAAGLAAGAGYKAAPVTRSAREMFDKGKLNRGSLKALGHQSKATAALGLGAVGAAYGANRVGNYRRGAGRPYKPLRGI